MKDFLKMLCFIAAVLGVLIGALVLLRRIAGRTYITVEED